MGVSVGRGVDVGIDVGVGSAVCLGAESPVQAVRINTDIARMVSSCKNVLTWRIILISATNGNS